MITVPFIVAMTVAITIVSCNHYTVEYTIVVTVLTITQAGVLPEGECRLARLELQKRIIDIAVSLVVILIYDPCMHFTSC
jgi:hypothetical protein